MSEDKLKFEVTVYIKVPIGCTAKELSDILFDHLAEGAVLAHASEGMDVFHFEFNIKENGYVN